ncbi:MAG: glycosyltransferase [Proteobacteria bacterium]|nr:glycosyltransferase [Pseudomonadota bacterium]
MKIIPSSLFPSSSISVVVPVFRSEKTLEELVKRLSSTLSSLTSQYEIILVNDGSPDKSWEIIKRLSREQSHVFGINLSRNFGQHNALLAGIKAAQFDFIVTLDDDLQNPPEEIPTLISKISEGYDVVYGVARNRKDSLFRKWASFGTRLALSSIAGASAARYASSYRIFNAKMKKAFESFGGGYLSIDALLGWGTTSFGHVLVSHEARKEGESNYKFGKLLLHSITMLTGYSIIPLRMASIVGLGFLGFGFLVLAWVIGRFIINGGSVPGFPFLASIVTLFSGAQLFSLGIIGEYIGRMHFRVMDRPTYIVSDTTQKKLGMMNEQAFG